MDAQAADPERSILKRLRGTAHYFDSRIGLSRIGLVVSLTIIAVAVVVLYHILREIDPEELVDAIEATNWRTLLIAGLFVAAGYLTLTFYDLFALRTIGRSEVPYRVAALAGFTSYSVGHNVGASVFSGGAVRYRIYSGWGLERHRGYQNLFRRRPDVLARQCDRARSRHPAGAAGGARRSINCRCGPTACSRSSSSLCSPLMSLGSGSSRA